MKTVLGFELILYNSLLLSQHILFYIIQDEYYTMGIFSSSSLYHSDFVVMYLKIFAHNHIESKFQKENLKVVKNKLRLIKRQHLKQRTKPTSHTLCRGCAVTILAVTTSYTELFKCQYW